MANNGPLGSETNNPVIDQGTLISHKSSVPGTLGGAETLRDNKWKLTPEYGLKVGADLILFSEDDDLFTKAKKLKFKRGLIVVAGHGNHTSMYNGDHKAIPVKSLADQIRKLRDYASGSIIVLSGCNVGAAAKTDTNAYPQQLADELKNTVCAANKFVAFPSNGEIEVTGYTGIQKTYGLYWLTGYEWGEQGDIHIEGSRASLTGVSYFNAEPKSIRRNPNDKGQFIVFRPKK